MNKTFCDRCGAEIGKRNGSPFQNKINVSGNGLKPVFDNSDICADCINELVEWFNQPETESERPE